MGKKQGALLVAGKYTLNELGLRNRRITAGTQEMFINTFLSVTFEKNSLELVDQMLCLICEVYEEVVPIEVRKWYSMRAEQGWPAEQTYGMFGSRSGGDSFDLDIGDVPVAGFIPSSYFYGEVPEGEDYSTRYGSSLGWAIRGLYYLPFPNTRVPFSCLSPAVLKKVNKMKNDITNLYKKFENLHRSLKAAVYSTHNVEDLFERLPGADVVWMEMMRRTNKAAEKPPCSDMPQVDLFAKVVRAIKEVRE